MDITHFIDKEPNRYEALAELQKQSIQSMNEDALRNIVVNFENYWDLRTEDFRNARELGYRQFIHESNYDENNNPIVGRIDILAVKGIREKQRRFLVDLKGRVKALNLQTKEDDEGTTLVMRIHNVLKQLKDGYDNIRRHYTAYERIANPTALPQTNSFFDASTMCDDDLDNSIPLQKCLIFTLAELEKAKYRRYKGQCCEERKTEEGYNTRAWEPKMTIEKFVYSLANKDDNFEMWKNFTSKGSIFREVIDNISKCNDNQFPDINQIKNLVSCALPISIVHKKILFPNLENFFIVDLSEKQLKFCKNIFNKWNGDINDYIDLVGDNKNDPEQNDFLLNWNYDKNTVADALESINANVTYYKEDILVYNYPNAIFSVSNCFDYLPNVYNYGVETEERYSDFLKSRDFLITTSDKVYF